MDAIAFPPFRPFPLLRNAHAQTIFGAYLPVPKTYQAVRREVLLSDGDRLVLHDDCPAGWQPGDRVALLMHGLGGSYRSGYMVRIAAKLNALGVRTFRKDLRGFGAGFETARGHCHAGRSEDLAEALEYVIQLCDQSPVALAAFSMGANIMLKFLGELGDLAPRSVERAVAVAPPIDLMHCAQNLRQRVNRIYDWTFTRFLHRCMRKRRRAVPDLADLRLRPLPRRLREFDDQYVAPLVGFSGAKEYYTRCSSGPLLTNICVPTQIIASADDPVIPSAMFENHPLSPSVDLQITSHGGHLGFVGVADVDPDRRWIDWRVIDWITRRQDATASDSAPSSAQSCA